MNSSNSDIYCVMRYCAYSFRNISSPASQIRRVSMQEIASLDQSPSSLIVCGSSYVILEGDIEIDRNTTLWAGNMLVCSFLFLSQNRRPTSIIGPEFKLVPVTVELKCFYILFNNYQLNYNLHTMFYLNI